MTTTPAPTEPPIRSYEEFLAFFFEACKPPERFRIGPEMEKFGVYDDTLRPLTYSGERGVMRIFDELVAKHGWRPDRESETGPIIALLRGGASITLEPGAQLELSGAAAEDIHAVDAELGLHLMEIGPVSRAMGVRWLGLGFHPFAAREDFEWVPKSRYGIMRDYLPKRGGHALDMMLRTSTVQGNYDFESEADAMRKMRVSLALAPLTTAMFANSPWKEGAAHGGATYRGRVWLDVDPDRSGLVPNLWKAGARFADYVEWALDVPMFLFKRGGEKIVNTGQTFRSFWQNGFEGHRPGASDWQMHLNTLFPEVRLKRTIEVRGGDAQGAALSCALPALWAGIFYDERALAEAEALTADFTHDEVVALRPDAWRLGLRAPFRGKPLQALAERTLESAGGGLERRARRNAAGQDERIHLAPLVSLVQAGRTPADDLLAAVAKASDPRRALVERSAFV